VEFELVVLLDIRIDRLDQVRAAIVAANVVGHLRQCFGFPVDFIKGCAARRQLALIDLVFFEQHVPGGFAKQGGRVFVELACNEVADDNERLRKDYLDGVCRLTRAVVFDVVAMSDDLVDPGEVSLYAE
jgi:hypothetical protein